MLLLSISDRSECRTLISADSGGEDSTDSYNLQVIAFLPAWDIRFSFLISATCFSTWTCLCLPLALWQCISNMLALPTGGPMGGRGEQAVLSAAGPSWPGFHRRDGVSHGEHFLRGNGKKGSTPWTCLWVQGSITEQRPQDKASL